MSNNLINKNIENRKIVLEILRKKLIIYFTQNKFNLRKLSRILNKNDAFSFKQTSLDLVKSKSSKYFSQIVNNNTLEINWSHKSYNTYKRNYSILFIPNYIEFNSDLMLGKLVSLPTENNICLPMNPKLTNIMEYYKYKKKI